MLRPWKVSAATAASVLSGLLILAAGANAADGDFETAFNGTGKLIGTFGGAPIDTDEIWAEAVQPDGKLVVAGDLNANGMVARLNPNGSFDSSFGGGDGIAEFSSGSHSGPEIPRAIAIQPDGKIVAVGSAGDSVLVARILGDPSADSGPAGGPGTGAHLQATPDHAAISALAISPTVFKAAASGASIARSVGARVAYSDNAAAKATFTILKPASGVMRGHRCRKPTRRAGGRRCTRWVSVGHFAHADQAGANSFHFTGRVHRRKLRPGRYRLRAQPLFNTRLGPTISTSFRIVRG
jgi:Domain of unknown function (DUF5122) beta-propeller